MPFTAAVVLGHYGNGLAGGFRHAPGFRAVAVIALARTPAGVVIPGHGVRSGRHPTKANPVRGWAPNATDE